MVANKADHQDDLDFVPLLPRGHTGDDEADIETLEHINDFDARIKARKESVWDRGWLAPVAGLVRRYRSPNARQSMWLILGPALFNFAVYAGVFMAYADHTSWSSLGDWETTVLIPTIILVVIALIDVPRLGAVFSPNLASEALRAVGVLLIVADFLLVPIGIIALHRMWNEFIPANLPDAIMAQVVKAGAIEGAMVRPHVVDGRIWLEVINATLALTLPPPVAPPHKGHAHAHGRPSAKHFALEVVMGRVLNGTA